MRPGAIDADSVPVRRNFASESIPIAIVAVVRRGNGPAKVLIARRGPGVHLAGRWELPGGKVRLDESPRDAALREVAEETGIELCGDRLVPLAVVEHDYPDRSIRLHAFICEVDSSVDVPARTDGTLRWVDANEFRVIEFPDANRSVTEAVLARIET